jgi:ketosteroid isomerase-like protein
MLCFCGRAHAIDTANAGEVGNIVHFEEPQVCRVNCVDPHPDCEESQKVIDTLKLIYEAYGRDDLAAVAPYIDDNCTTFEEDTKKLIIGKKAVLEEVQKRLDQYRNDKESPLLSFTIERPYAEVKGDMAVVTFIAYKQFGGKHPQKYESHCTDIFVKKDGKWLKAHYRSNWQPVS